MSIEAGFISLVIPIEKINEVYPGGFEKFKEDRKTKNGYSIIFDDYIVIEGSMSPGDMEMKVKYWENMGLKTISYKDGVKKWEDVCVVDYLSGPTLPCDWLIVKDGIISHVNDKSGKIV